MKNTQLKLIYVYFSRGSVIVKYDVEFDPFQKPDLQKMSLEVEEAIRINSGKLGNNYIINYDTINHQGKVKI